MRGGGGMEFVTKLLSLVIEWPSLRVRLTSVIIGDQSKQSRQLSTRTQSLNLPQLNRDHRCSLYEDALENTFYIAE